MKKILIPALMAAALLPASAQTMKIHFGQITVAAPAAQTGEMAFSNSGQSLTVMGKTYNVADIDSITIDNSVVMPSSMSVAWAGGGAKVTVSADIYPQLTLDAQGGYVSVVANAALQQEVIYTLSGTSADGGFYMDGEYKAGIVLDGLTLTSKRGAAIDVENGKRIDVVLNDGTVNTLADDASGQQKACFFINGHAEFEGAGQLVLTGNKKHAFSSDEYTYFKKSTGTVRVLSAAGDGFNVNQYFRMAGGTLEIANTKGDGIDVGITKDATDELNGQMMIEGGSVKVSVAAEDVKGLKSDSLMTISGGTVEANVSGNGSKGISTNSDLVINQASGGSTLVKMVVTGTTYKPGDPVLEAKCRGIKVDRDFTLDGGHIDIKATGQSSKAVSVDGTFYWKSGTKNCYVDATNTVQQ